MKKYILIQNDGEIENNSFELIGASTKRNDTTKIGLFGSGLKYSIAYMMRNNIEFKIFSGEQELIFTTIPEKLKDQTFDRICINGRPTSYTTTMGPTWTEDWTIIREIYCNALDEGNCQMIKETENINAIAEKTRIYIEATKSLMKIIEEWDTYFLTERDPIIKVDKVYTSYLGDKNYQAVEIYKKTNGVVYRKGIQVGIIKNMVYDYNFDDLCVNEDRTAKHLYGSSYAVADLVAKMPTEDYVTSILRTGCTNESSYEYTSLGDINNNTTFSPLWIDFSKNYFLVVRERSGHYAEEIALTKKEVFLIPLYFAKELVKHVPGVNIVGLGRVIEDIGMLDVEATPKMKYLLKEVLSSLNELQYPVSYDINIVQFDDMDILGKADLKTKQIYLSSKVFDMGRREIAMTLMEENEHIISGKGDETRAFQNHLFSSWLKSMENINGLFL